VSRAALVVGSGPNGVAAAIALAQAGRAVTVLEAAERAGGAVASEELTLPGFVHDTFSAVYPAAVASPVFARLPLERHGLRWVHPRRCYAQVLPDGRAVALSRDVGETAAALAALAPGDGEAWRRFAAPYLEHWGAWQDTMLAGFPPLRGAARMLAARRFGFAKLLLMPAEALAQRLFAHEGSRAWLYGSARHGDVPPGHAGSAIAAVHLNLMGHAVGWPSPEGGAGRLAEALVSHLRSLGGEVRTGARVVRVGVERGRAVGVELEGGERLAGSIVVADVTPAGLLRLAGDALGERYAAELRAWRRGPSTLKVDWALDGPIPWSAPEAREAGTVHLGEAPFLILGQQSLADPTRAPAGKHTAWAYTHDQADADAIEAQVERSAPGFRELVLARHVMGPAELERRDANLEGGDVGGGSFELDQAVFRPVAGLSPYRTPVRGLFIGSASAFPGGAVHGVPGHAAARAAILEGRIRSF
jgi:phytoene dehydrogenase-like protein